MLSIPAYLMHTCGFAKLIDHNFFEYVTKCSIFCNDKESATDLVNMEYV